MDVSVIICTYNPREPLFSRVLDALCAAVKVYSMVEVIIVDNNSDIPVASYDRVQEILVHESRWRVVVEEAQGLTHARLRGISEASGELLIFVDDDNIISADFVLEAVSIALQHDHIGVFSGNIELEFETSPPKWIEPYKGLLVYRNRKDVRWSNFNSEDCMPAGAGMCIRRSVALYYQELHSSGARRFILDRNKETLMSAGDNDIALCACDIGLGIGVFPRLNLYHFIPDRRVSRRYIIDLVYGIYFSGEVLNYIRGKKIGKLGVKYCLKEWISGLRYIGYSRKVFLTGNRARLDARVWAIRNLAG